MSIMIKGMGLPKGCASCEFNIIGRCIPMGRSLTYKEFHFYDKVSDDCPLVEIPQKARLIDAKGLFMDIIHRFDYFDDFLEMLEEAPTIFEEEQHERKSSRH